MKFIASAALLAGLAAAYPAGPVDDCYEESTTTSSSSAAASTATSSPQKFGLVAIDSGSAVQYSGVVATSGYFALGGSQNATCSSPSKFATFYIENGDAYLYTPSSGPAQQLFVDRSGMGQGVTGYTTAGGLLAPKDAERTGFAVGSDGFFTFDGLSPRACPDAANGGYSLWFTTIENPAGNSGCLGVGLRVVDSNKPVACEYSKSP